MHNFFLRLCSDFITGEIEKPWMKYIGMGEFVLLILKSPILAKDW